MYSRSFFTDEKNAPTPPENYSGTALTEEETVATCSDADEAVSTECDECSTRCECEKNEGFSGIFSGLGSIGSLFGGGGVKSLLSHIGTEEILIIATALFLFLSKEGDKECALMLLLLLIV